MKYKLNTKLSLIIHQNMHKQKIKISPNIKFQQLRIPLKILTVLLSKYSLDSIENVMLKVGLVKYGWINGVSEVANTTNICSTVWLRDLIGNVS